MSKKTILIVDEPYLKLSYIPDTFDTFDYDTHIPIIINERKEEMARKYGKGSNESMAMLLGATSIMLTNNIGFGYTPQVSYRPQRFIKGSNYYKKDDGHGGDKAKARRLKQFLNMPIHERIKQYL